MIRAAGPIPLPLLPTRRADVLEHGHGPRTGAGAGSAAGPGARSGSGSGCASTSSCGTSSSGMDPELAARIATHPCYSQEAHRYYARMHVPVAPGCNIQCNYCNRKFDCANESRPGVTSTLLTPEEAAAKVVRVAERVPQLSVVGIAGPGEPLANANRTLGALELVAERSPDLTLCLSTNGLTLLDHVDRIADLGVEHVTVTVNMTDPEIGERIYPWVAFRGRRYTGRDAARVLSERQLAGIAALTERGILCKVNSVMIPGVNDEHLVDVSRTVRDLGAFLHNIMPLVSAPEHGTVYGLEGRRGPTPAELAELQGRCEELAGDSSAMSMGLMRHCRQCRADAVGMLGEDRSAEFVEDGPGPEPAGTSGEASAGTVTGTPGGAGSAGLAGATGLAGAAGNGAAGSRREERERIERRRAAARQRLDVLGVRDSADARPDRVVRIAVATGDGLSVGRHTGPDGEFWVFEAGPDWLRLLQIRSTDRYGAAMVQETAVPREAATAQEAAVPREAATARESAMAREPAGVPGYLGVTGSGTGPAPGGGAEPAAAGDLVRPADPVAAMLADCVAVLGTGLPARLRDALERAGATVVEVPGPEPVDAGIEAAVIATARRLLSGQLPEQERQPLFLPEYLEVSA